MRAGRRGGGQENYRTSNWINVIMRQKTRREYKQCTVRKERGGARERGKETVDTSLSQACPRVLGGGVGSTANVINVHRPTDI